MVQHKWQTQNKSVNQNCKTKWNCRYDIANSLSKTVQLILQHIFLKIWFTYQLKFIFQTSHFSSKQMKRAHAYTHTHTHTHTHTQSVHFSVTQHKLPIILNILFIPTLDTGMETDCRTSFNKSGAADSLLKKYFHLPRDVVPRKEVNTVFKALTSL